jgi:thiamine-phosphate pyrophosphorylase
MAESCLLYYITDRTAFPGNELDRRRRLLGKIAEATRAGVDYIQLREKDLPTPELESLAREAVRAIRDDAQLATGDRQLATALLINSHTDVALAVDADGVHLRSDDVAPQEVKRIWQLGAGAARAGEKPHFSRKERARNGAPGARFDTLGQKSLLLAKAARSGAPQVSPKAPLIGVSCHSPAEVAQAEANGADFAVFAPVFEKKDAPAAQPTGLAMLAQACKARIPVLALGGVTLGNARSCLEAGAAGIAAIRLFQENDIAAVVKQLRG